MTFHRDLLPQSSPLPPHDLYGRAQTQLGRGDSLLSATGAFQLAMDPNTGNVTLSVWSEVLEAWSQILTFGTNNAKQCVMQDDGNLVISDANSKVLWASSWYWYDLPPPNSHSFLRCQDDGNLVVFNGDGVLLGSSNTYAGPR